MEEKLHKLVQNSETGEIYHPEFFRLGNGRDRDKLNDLLEKAGHIKVFDQLQGQLEELVKLQNPKIKFTKDELAKAGREHVGKTSPHEYGVWVYYPWSQRLLHLLDEKEFVAVRTSRNQYKITPEEREILAQKKIGVIGLSVGQSVAVTMAMERIFGEIRLADFDILELSNYNRIRTGLHNLNVAKVISVAREIAEIDPFLKITCYTEGIHEKNIDDFFLKGGKLDMVLEECDGLNVKILCRQKAKGLQVPVIMETSDRGMVDVERFDLEPNRPLLHGLIAHLDLNKLKEAKTNEEKIPFILPMVGIDKISPRLKASMMEVEQTLTTWPQLASAVTIGGGLATDVCRRIALDQFRGSGRFYVDVEELISDEKKEETSKVIPAKEEDPLTTEYMRSTFKKISLTGENFLTPGKELMTELLEAATQAPSGGNSQPWQWVYSKGLLLLFFDKQKSKSFLDYDDMASYISLGAAYENLVLKAHEKNLEVVSELFPVKDDEKVIAAIRFAGKDSPLKNAEAHIQNELASSIFMRCTNRTVGQREILGPGIFEEMKKIVDGEKENTLQIADTPKQLKILGEVAGACDRVRFLHPQSHYDLYHNEVRWNKEENESTRDGVDIATIPFTPSELAGFKMAMDDKAIAYLAQWNAGRGFEKLSKKAVEEASAMILLSHRGNSKKDAFNGGRMMQRIWLWATSKDLSVHPIMVPLMFFARLSKGKGEGLNKEMRDELGHARKKFEQVFRSQENNSEISLLKIGKADAPLIRSLRRLVEEVCIFL